MSPQPRTISPPRGQPLVVPDPLLAFILPSHRHEQEDAMRDSQWT
jgi:hypothetical protein